jgi:hypothetical protein
MRNRVLALIAVGAVLLATRAALGGLASDNLAKIPSTSSQAASSSSVTPKGSSAGDQPDAKGPEDPNGLWFRSATEQVGLDAVKPGASRDEFGTMSGGLAAGDYNQDGLIDLFFSKSGQPNQLFQARPDGTYRDVTDKAGLASLQAGPSDGSAGTAWADVDGDGDLDLFVGGFGQKPDQMFVNQGDGTFTDRAKDLGLGAVGPADLPHATSGVAFADWDRDGDLDLVTTDWVSPGYGTVAPQSGENKPKMCELDPVSTLLRDRSRAATTRLWENDGSGRFGDVTKTMGVDTSMVAGLTPLFSDLDDDGWIDLLISGDFCTSRLYQNVGGTKFVDKTAASAVNTAENAMGSVVDDLDGDGQPDWFVTAISGGPDDVGCLSELPLVGCSGNRLFRGLGGFGFEDGTEGFGVSESGWAWGTLAEDLNNNGYRDLLTVGGQNFGTPEGAPPGTFGVGGPLGKALEYFASGSVRLWQGGPERLLNEVAKAAGLDTTGQLKAVVAIDQDEDGDLDLVVTDTGSAPRFYRNDTPKQGHWLQLKLSDDTTPNTHAIGARVRLSTEAGQASWVGEVRAGGGYQSSGPGTLHVGLGDRTDVTSIEVRWPDSDTYEAYPIPSIDEAVDVVRRPPGK